MAAPRPKSDGVKDPRTVGQPNADGLSTLLDLVDHWRRYLTDPGLYLRHITG
ncbi:hypothetical protein LZ318_00320 [Saccharopolyspora indica]|uniref:hypothetical protein n=1 Tax=Saccharopolyspora indica TaxID=1229659 RepID=UPI002FE50368